MVLKFASLVPVPPSGCGDISATTCSLSDPDKVITNLASPEVASKVAPLPINPNPTMSRASYACDGTCPGINSKTSLLASATSSSLDVGSWSKLPCATPGAATFMTGMLSGVLAMVTGGLSSEAWNPVDESYYEKLQEKADSLNANLTACVDACANLIQTESYNFICCSVSFLNNWTRVELTRLSQQIKTNQLMVHLALGLIVLILIYILTS